MKNTLYTALNFATRLLSMTLLTITANAKTWYPVIVDVWNPPFDMASPRTQTTYTPLSKAKKSWDICSSFPHMKDAYWLAVNYGIAEEAKRQGVKLQLLEAGGYTRLNNQISQIEDCVVAGADAVIISAISFDGLNNLVQEIRGKGLPVIDLVNGMSSDKLSAKSLVSFGEMGFKAGEYLAKLHPKASKAAQENSSNEKLKSPKPTPDKIKVAWFPGPPGAGWVEAGNIDSSNIDNFDRESSLAPNNFKPVFHVK